MTQVQLQGLLSKKQQLIRARKEFNRAKLNDTVYRGVRFVKSQDCQCKHCQGDLTYRGIKYVK